MSTVVARCSDTQPDTTADSEQRYNDVEPLPIIGTCVALFAFDGRRIARAHHKHIAGTANGTIEIRDGEKLLLIQKDTGDGWTRVRKVGSMVEGFTPTSYLKCEWYPT